MPSRKSVERLESLSLVKLETIVREVSLRCVEYFSQSSMLQEVRVSQVTSSLLDREIVNLQELLFNLTPHYFHPQIVVLVVKTLSSLQREESLSDWSCSQESHHQRRRRLVRKQVLAQFSRLLCHQAVTELSLDSSLELGLVKNICQLLPDLDHLVSLDLGPWPCEKQGLLSGCQGSSLMFLPRLTSLSLSDIDTEIIKNISVFSPHLTTLRVRSSQLSDEAAYFLSKLRKLQKLHFSQVTNVSSHGYATLLRNLHRLTDLSGCDCFPAALSCLETGKRRDPPHLRLERLETDSPLTETDLKLVVSQCPALTTLKLVYRPAELEPSPDPLTPHLARLALLTDLHTINIVSADFYNHSVFRLVQTSPARVTRLELTDCDEMNLHSVEMIGQLCPSLLSLGLSSCHFTLDPEQRQTIAETVSLQTPAPAQRPFARLREGRFRLTSPTHLVLLKYILHFSDRLRSFSLEVLTQSVEDRLVVSLVSWGRWSQLQSFQLTNSSRLSLMAANTIIQSCPQVKHIGSVKTWGQVSREDLSSFQREIASRNLQLQIS